MNQEARDLRVQSIFRQLKCQAAVDYIEANKLESESVIYPIREKDTEVMYNGQPTMKRGQLYFFPLNHEKGTPECTIQSQNWKSERCEKCKKDIPLKDWYFDLTLSLIIDQYRYDINKSQILECVKFYKDGEYELLLTPYEEAAVTDKYIKNDPIIAALQQAQNDIIQKAQGRQNVILEQNPIMMEQFKNIIDQAIANAKQQ